MKKLILAIGTISAVAIPATLLISCDDSKTSPDQTPPTTQPPSTQPPTTQPPVTQPPVTQPPVTQPPVTQPPVTQPPVTLPPAETTPPVDQPAKVAAPTETKPDTTNKDQDQLDDGIFDYRTDKSLSNAELNDAFSKYTTQIDFAGDSNGYGDLAMLTKPKVDRTRKMMKVMVVGTPNSNNGNVIFFTGILSYMIDASGSPMSDVYFTCMDFNEISKIGDHSRFGSKRFISVFNPAADDRQALFILVKGIDVDDLLTKLKTIVNKEFTTA